MRSVSRICMVAIVGLVMGVCEGQVDLTGKWIPTDLNKAVISRLTNSTLGNLQTQIAGYSTLGIITNADVQSWLTTLINNPNARDGTIRWQPQNPAKCFSGVRGCTKSIRITVLEFSYGNPSGSDCQAKATVAADAILPPYATLRDNSNGNQLFMPQGNPITYELVAAPNATASSCTYIITYPAPTQNLANQLCTTQFDNSSCTTSPCVPCNANQTIIANSGDPENNCTPQNGIAPALVAAIEGAAQCLSVGGIGRFGCQVGYSFNNSQCTVMHCFPGDAIVQMESGKEASMRTLKIGDRVQVAKQDGSLGYEEIYFFGHRDQTAIASFVKVHLSVSVNGQEVSRSIEASSHHFLHVRRQGWQSSKFSAMRAKDVRAGDWLQISHEGKLIQAEVVALERVTKQGLWNPYTMSGNIVVNGVAVSSHSEWLLDPIFDYLGLTSLLPAVYQVLLAPVRLLYFIIGQQAMETLDNRLQLGNLVVGLGSSISSGLSWL